MTEPEVEVVSEEGPYTVSLPAGDATVIMADGKTVNIASLRPIEVQTQVEPVDVLALLAQAAHNAYYVSPGRTSMADPHRWENVVQAVREAEAPYRYPSPSAYQAACAALSRERRTANGLGEVVDELMIMITSIVDQHDLGEENEAKLLELAGKVIALKASR